MTKEQQRIAIAEACGWKCVEPRPRVKDSPYTRWMCGDDFREFRNLPDYPNDLNAMHEAESIICTSIDWTTKYMTILKRIGSMRGIRSTAAQRAEAFLRTKGLWKEE